MSENLSAYINLRLRPTADEYAVLVGGKLIGTGTDLRALLRQARRKHPGKTPAVAKICGPQTLVLSQLAADTSYEELMREYDLQRQDILAVLDYAAKTISEELVRAQ